MTSITTYIVGLPYYQFKESNLKVNDTVFLSQDKDNKFSDTAVYVHHINGHKLGHIRKEDSKEIYNSIPNASASLYARVLKINPASVEIQVQIPDSYLSVKENNTKETNMFDKLINTNKIVAGNAAFMEAGRMANNQLAKVAASKAPMFARGYVDTPVGKLVIANLAAVIAAQYRPNDPKLAKLANAMMQSAYVEAIQSFKIEDMIKEFLSNADIKAALDKVTVEEKST